MTVALTVTAPVDDDGDGMADSWEAANSVSDPNADPDGDGATNLQEYLAGTNPNSAASRFAVVNTLVDAGISPGVFLGWQASGGVRCRVQYSDDLAAGFMDILRPASLEIQPGEYGTVGIASFTDTTALLCRAAFAVFTACASSRKQNKFWRLANRTDCRCHDGTEKLILLALNYFSGDSLSPAPRGSLDILGLARKSEGRINGWTP